LGALRKRDDGPVDAVPVLDERVPVVLSIALPAHGPHIIAPDRRDAVEDVAGRAGVRTGITLHCAVLAS
jgi:hypothetical protein